MSNRAGNGARTTTKYDYLIKLLLIGDSGKFHNVAISLDIF
jgi:hypothetical protein